MRIRIFKEAPEVLIAKAQRLTNVKACAQLKSIAADVEPDGRTLDLGFYFTRKWLEHAGNSIADGDYTLVFERIPEAAQPVKTKFRDEFLILPANDIVDYFRGAVHIIVRTPPRRPATPRTSIVSISAPVRTVATTVPPKKTEVSTVASITCGAVLFSAPVTIATRTMSVRVFVAAMAPPRRPPVAMK
jgi:hypothetical protein